VITGNHASGVMGTFPANHIVDLTIAGSQNFAPAIFAFGAEKVSCGLSPGRLRHPLNGNDLSGVTAKRLNDCL